MGATIKEDIQYACQLKTRNWNRSKLMIVGEGRAGKTALANSIIGKPFNDTEPTVGINNLSCSINYDDFGNGQWNIYDRPEKELETAIAMSIRENDLKDSKYINHRKTVKNNEQKDSIAIKKSVLAAPKPGEIDDDFVGKCLADFIQTSSDLIISLFDFGGQSIFDVIHHLFLTPFGVYIVVFNMMWLAEGATETDRASCWARLEGWVNSIVMHTSEVSYNVLQSAPIAFAGTCKDKVIKNTSDAQSFFKDISNKLYSKIDSSRCPVVWNPEDELWFFPVDNIMGRGDRSLTAMLLSIEKVMKQSDHVTQEKPLIWLQALDRLNFRKDITSFSMTEVREILASCGIEESEVSEVLLFFSKMGELLWINEDGLRDTVIMHPISSFVTPATRVICKHVASVESGESYAHEDRIQRECKHRFPTEWESMIFSGVVRGNLLHALVGPNHVVVVNLMVKFGLIVAVLTPEETDVGVSPYEKRYIVPSLLHTKTSAVVDQDQHSPPLASFSSLELQSSIFFSFFLPSKSSSWRKPLTGSQLASEGYLPQGLFLRYLGKLLTWSQLIPPGYFYALSENIYNNDAAILFGLRSFRIRVFDNYNVICVTVENSRNYAALILRLKELMEDVIKECFGTLHFEVLLLFHSETLTGILPVVSSHYYVTIDITYKAYTHKQPLILPNNIQIVRSMLTERYSKWWQLPETSQNCDMFLSYRWGEHDSRFVSLINDALLDCHDDHVIKSRENILDIFCYKLLTAKVFVPFCSHDALIKMKGHNPQEVDNVLLEWILALEAQKRGTLTILPIPYGSIREGSPFLDFDWKGLSLLPEIAPTKTVDKAVSLMKYPSSPDLQSLTVRGVVTNILGFLYSFRASEFNRLKECIPSCINSIREAYADFSQLQSVRLQSTTASARTADGKDYNRAWSILNDPTLTKDHENAGMLKLILEELGVVESLYLDKCTDQAIYTMANTLKIKPKGIFLEALCKNPNETTQVLLAAGSNFDLQDKYEVESPLHYAARCNYKEVAEVLLAAGANVNLKYQNGFTPLFVASLAGHLDITNMLLTAGAQPNWASKAMLGDMEGAKELLTANPEVVNQQNEDDQSALYLVVSYNRIELGELLLNAGANVDLQDKWGHTALYMAVYFNRKELAELLLIAGANVDLKDKDGETPLMIAESRDDIEMMTLLTKFKKNHLAPKKVIWGRSRIMIVGEGRAGKTTFYRCMKGESTLNSNTESTCGLEESAVRFCDIEGKKEGISLSALSGIDKVNLLDVAATKQIKRNIEERKKMKNADEASVVKSKLKAGEASVAESKLDLNNKIFPPNLSSQKDDKPINIYEQEILPTMTTEKEKVMNINLMDEFSNLVPITSEPQIMQVDSNIKPNVQVKEYKKSIVKAPSEEDIGLPITLLGNISHKDLDISVIDYGGQNIFHCFHHLFLKPYGVYCILFNMEKFLLDQNSTLYHIRYWFNSIILHTSSSENKQNINLQVPIIIVGSHRDKLKQRLNIIKISNLLKTAFKNSPGIANIIQCSAKTNKCIYDFIYSENGSDSNKRENKIVETKSGKAVDVKDHEFFFFPLDNSKNNESDDIFQQMMMTIFEIISNSDFVKEEISSDFFMVLQQFDIKYKHANTDTENNILHCMKTTITSKEISEKRMLKFFIEKGVCLKFNENIIFHFDTFLIKYITKVIFDSRYHNKENYSKHQYDIESQILLKSGIVSKTFIRKLINEDGKNRPNDTDLIINFMLYHKLLISINEKSEEKFERYLIPSMLPESKLSYKDLLPTSALFFVKTQSEKNENFNPNIFFMSDNFFYQLMCKLVDLSKVASTFGTGQDNFIFKDLILIRLGTHIIILKSFPEANCVLLHALNKTILSNFIIILSYFIENEITPRIDYDVVVDHKIYRSFSNNPEIGSRIDADQNIIKNSTVLIRCPKDIEAYKFLPLITVLLCDYNCVPKIVFYDNIKDIEWSEIEIEQFELVLIVIGKEKDKMQFTGGGQKYTTIVYLNVSFTDFKKQLQKNLSINFGLQNLDESLTMGGSIKCNNTIRLFKNIIYTGNSVQRFYNEASRIYYGWESNSHDDDQISYFKVSVIPSETNLFFKSIISLNGIAYVFHQLPEIVSHCASPAKFLGDIFADLLKSLEPTSSRGDKKDVDYLNVQKSYKILECLVLLSSTITNTIFRKPLESAELELKHKKIEIMIERLLKSKSMGNEEKIISALLGKNICPLIKNNENNDVMLRKLRGLVFTDSIVMKCIFEKENQTHMYALIGSWQVSNVIDKAFWGSAKTTAWVENDQMRRSYSNCATLSSNPSLLLFLDFIFSIINIFLVIYFSYPNKASVFGEFLYLLLSSIVLGVSLRELGELYCVFSEIYQAKSNLSNIFLVAFRTIYVYFGDFWNFFDVIGLVSLLSWLILQYIYSPPYSSKVEMMLSITLKLSPIPLSIGLLRYFVVLKDIGQFIIIIFSMTYDLWRFGLIYVIVLLGFGISLNALFNEYSDFSNYSNLLLSMFQMSLNVFEYDTFQVSDEYRHVGQAIMVIMALSVSIILVNAIIAKFGITFREINENVLGVWAINKAGYISRYLHNKNPALMLPPPLNIFIFVIYLVMRVCAWICNIAVFMIPDKGVHNWWYAHADLVKDFSIGMCSSISSAVVSLIMILICAAVETFAFMSCFSKSKICFRICACINQFSILMESSIISNQAIKPFTLYYIIMLSVLLCLRHLYSILFLILRAVLVFILIIIGILALGFLWIVYVFILLVDIFEMLYKNIKFLNYQLVISSFFLTKEGRDIWDIQGPKILEKMIQSELPENDSYLLRISSLSRIKWFYNNFVPEQSLRLIFEEYESGLGEKFFIEMMTDLREGAGRISLREKRNMYDTIPFTVAAQANAEDMLLTHKEIKRFFEIQCDENEDREYQLKNNLNRMQCRQDKFENRLDHKLQKIQEHMDHKFQKLSENIHSILKKLKKDTTDSFFRISSENQSDIALADLSDNESPNKNKDLPPDDPLSVKGEAYMKYFEDAMRTTKIDEGTYVSKFSLGDN